MSTYLLYTICAEADKVVFTIGNSYGEYPMKDNRFEPITEISRVENPKSIGLRTVNLSGLYEISPNASNAYYQKIYWSVAPKLQ